MKMPEWDAKMEKALKKRDNFKKEAISQILKDMDKLVSERSMKLLKMVAEHSFEAGVEAEVHDR